MSNPEEKTALATIDLLERRLERIRTLLTGNEDADESLQNIAPLGKERTVLARLAKVEDGLSKLSNKSPVLGGLLKLCKSSPDFNCLAAHTSEFRRGALRSFPAHYDGLPFNVFDDTGTSRSHQFICYFISHYCVTPNIHQRRPNPTIGILGLFDFLTAKDRSIGASSRITREEPSEARAQKCVSHTEVVRARGFGRWRMLDGMGRKSDEC